MENRDSGVADVEIDHQQCMDHVHVHGVVVPPPPAGPAPSAPSRLPHNPPPTTIIKRNVLSNSLVDINDPGAISTLVPYAIKLLIKLNAQSTTNKRSRPSKNNVMESDFIIDLWSNFSKLKTMYIIQGQKKQLAAAQLLSFLSVLLSISRAVDLQTMECLLDLHKCFCRPVALAAERLQRRGSVGSLDSGMSVSFQQGSRNALHATSPRHPGEQRSPGRLFGGIFPGRQRKLSASGVPDTKHGQVGKSTEV